MRIFHVAALAAAFLSAVWLPGCVNWPDPGDNAESGWLDERAAVAASREPPQTVPTHRLEPGSIIEVRATTRLLMERGAYVRDRAEQIAAGERDTETFVRQALERAALPGSGSR